VKSYVYLGARLLATIAPNGASERVEYNHPDKLSTRLVTNNQDTTSFEQVTLPFGTALDAESSGATKRRFISYDRSGKSGLDYAVNRHYDPLQGRFTQVDPIGMASVDLQNPQSLNLIRPIANMDALTCSNCSVTRVDKLD
jgi:RHS repeat-associated protein